MISRVSAQSFDFTQGLYDGLEKGGDLYKGDSINLGAVISNILPWVYAVAIIILLFNIIITALRIQAQGKKGLEAAKKNILYSIIGIVVVLLAAAFTLLLTNYLTAGSIVAPLSN